MRSGSTTTGQGIAVARQSGQLLYGLTIAKEDDLFHNRDFYPGALSGRSRS